MRAILSAVLSLAIWPILAIAEPRVEHLQSYRWHIDGMGFGGFSGLEISEDGNNIWVVSDGGFLSPATLMRDPSDGSIQSVSDYDARLILAPNGAKIRGFFNDSEALARNPEGDIFISFEGVHRVWKFAGQGNPSIPLADNPAFEELQNNSSLETLAVTPAGSLITLPERSGLLTRPFPVFRLRQGTWDQPYEIERISPFIPVGGDFGPDNKFYLLERHLNGFFGFQTRIRRFDFSEEDGFSNPQTLVQTRSGKHDNLEGLGVWRDTSGRIRLTMISDDNFKSFQRTEIVEYAVLE